ncbi:MAG: hypothetical protein ABJE66_13265 [Deltaproteobacteria bacterium]
MRVFASILASGLVSGLLGCVPASAPHGGGGDDDQISNTVDGGALEGSGSGSGSGSAAMTATDFVGALDRGGCDEAFTCKSSYPSNAPVSFAEQFGSSNQQCYDLSVAYEQYSTINSEIAAGNITWNPTDAATCLATLTYPSSCATYWNNGATYPNACKTALQGHASNGSACLVDWDCSDFTAHCDGNSHKCSTN